MSYKNSGDLEKIRKIKESLETSQVKEKNIVNESESSFLDYSLSVITSRALPDLKDGLKPVHRRILYAAYEEKMFSDSRFRKSATLVGAVMGAYHPHGDKSIYDALVRMSQNFSMRYPLLEGQGNFGSIDGDAPAAMRYTEVRMSKLGEKFLEGIKEDCVDFVPNYDGSKEEPKILPIIAPSVLLNGGEGIAVAMASKIPSHNLKELCEAVISLIDDPEGFSDQRVSEIIKGPDFPTGGIVLKYKGVEEYLKKGKGSFLIRARLDEEDEEKTKEKKGKDDEEKQIIVTEIPFGVKKSNLIKQIARLASDEKNPKYKVDPYLQRFLKNIRDESNLKEGIRLILEFKKGVDLEAVKNILYKYTSLEQPYTANLVILVDGKPETIGVKALLERYLQHQLELLVRKTKFNLEKLKSRIHILEGRKAVVTDLGTVVKIISEEEEPEKIIQEKYSLSEIQLKDVFELPLRKLKKIEFQDLINELDEKNKSREEHEERLRDEGIRKNIIKSELQNLIDEYSNDKRRTKIDISVYEKRTKMDYIAREDLVVQITRKNYISAIPLKEIKAQKRKGMGVQTGLGSSDTADIVCTSSHDDLFLFTNFGKVFKLKSYDIGVSDSSKWTNKPRLVKNLLNPDKSTFRENEKIIKLITLPNSDYSKDLFLFFATKKGMIKKTPLNLFKNINRAGKIAIKLQEGDELRSVVKIKPDSDILLASSEGYALWFKADGVVGKKDPKPILRALSRTARGVKGINLKNKKENKEYELISASSNYEGNTVFTVDESGLGQWTELGAYGRGYKPSVDPDPEKGILGRPSKPGKPSNRRGKGLLIRSKEQKEKGLRKIVACVFFKESEELLLMSNKNHMIRLEASQVKERKSRTALGLKLMELGEKNEKLVHFTKVPKIDEEEGEIVSRESEYSA